MEKIHVSFIKDLRNREFSGLIDTLGDLFAGYESDNSSFIKATEKLQSHNKDLLKLKDTKPRHHLTRIINEKVRNRTEYLSCLRLRIESALMSPLPEERIAADRLMYWIDPYRKPLFKPSIGVQGQSVKDLKYDREKSADIQRFTALLNLDYVFETLVNITEEINTLFSERVEDRVSRAINGKEVRSAAYFDLQVLLSILKMMHHLSDSKEERGRLSNFSAEINSHLTRFRKELRSRNTKKRNKKVLSTTAERLIGTDERSMLAMDQKSNQPIVIYDELKINGKQDTSVLDACNGVMSDTTIKPNISKKGRLKEKMSNTKMRLDDSSLSKREREGGDKQLPNLIEIEI